MLYNEPYIMTFTSSVRTAFGTTRSRWFLAAGIIIIVALFIGWHFATRPSAAASTSSTVTHVHVASVSSLSDKTGPLLVTGVVTSLNQASVLAQSSGEIVSLSHALGDRVGAGAVIASFENSSQQAAVLQAQGAYEGAQAALANASGNTAQNSSVTAAQAGQNVQNSAAAVRATLQSAYASLDDAIHTKSDTLFNNARSANPALLSFTIPDSQLVVTIQSERLALEATLKDAQTIANNGSATDIDAAISAMSADVQTVQTFLNNMAAMISQAVPNQVTSTAAIGAYQATIGGARSEVVASQSALASAKTAYDAAAAGATTASNTATGGTNASIAAAQANVKSALGSLNAAQANLEKTIVRSPIAGTIVSLSVTRGDFVSNFSPVAVISNPGTLQVDTNVTSDDAKTLVIGGSATISGNTQGTIVFIAPALDPSTGKIEVKVALTGGQPALTDGETVTVALSRQTASGTAAKGGETPTVTIPLSAAKILPSGPVVFTVSSSTLVANPVTFGPIVGDQVTVTGGITPEMDIVTDARGLSDGQTVVVDSQ